MKNHSSISRRWRQREKNCFDWWKIFCLSFEVVVSLLLIWIDKNKIEFWTVTNFLIEDWCCFCEYVLKSILWIVKHSVDYQMKKIKIRFGFCFSSKIFSKSSKNTLLNEILLIRWILSFSSTRRNNRHILLLSLVFLRVFCSFSRNFTKNKYWYYY